jgi:hypothetical protein
MSDWEREPLVYIRWILRSRPDEVRYFQFRNADEANDGLATLERLLDGEEISSEPGLVIGGWDMSFAKNMFREDTAELVGPMVREVRWRLL